jgi:hypothetical protein
MKKLFVLMLLAFSASAMAQHHGHGPGFRHGHGFKHGHSWHAGHGGYGGYGYWARGHSGAWNWAVPAAIGGLIIYEATRQPIIVQPNPVIIQQQSLPLAQDNPSCTPWTEVHSSDGTISRTRTCTQ